MAGGVQTIPRVLLGEALKQLRSHAGVTLDAAATVVGKDRARLVKFLDGRATLTGEELETLVDFLGAKASTRSEILALGIEARKRAVTSSYQDLAPGAFRRIGWLEAMAKDVWIYEKGVYPLLLQSPDYVEAVVEAGDAIWWEGIGNIQADRVSFRFERQRRIFESDPPKRMELMFTDDALLAMVGGPEVMRGQLAHVLEMMDRHPNLTVRVVPLAIPGNPVQQGGLKMLRFGEVLRPIGILSVAYGPSIYFDETEDTERFLRAFNKLRELALSSRETRAFLEEKLRRCA